MKPFTIIAAVVCGIYLLLEWTEGKTCYYTTTIDENGAVKWIRDKGDCDVIKFGGVKTTATPKSFTGKGISTTTEDILTYSTAHTSEDTPSTEAVGSTNNPPGTSIPTCPTNMINGTCSCQATCEDPNGQARCNSDCLGTEGCTCPAGFLMQGSDCVSESECGCFVAEANLVIPNGEASVNDNCTQTCSCNNNQLTWEDYSCSTNAMCDVKNEVRKCYCNAGFEGDGETCVSLPYRDCQDVYDAGHTQDGVYTIMPTGWPGLPFNVSCKIENGGGWTVVQRRVDGSVDFYLDWDNYKQGFGNLNSEFWIGNEKLHILTNAKRQEIRIDLVNKNGAPYFAKFDHFRINNETDNYRLSVVGTYSGTADSRSNPDGYALRYHLARPFSTYDRDNDPWSGNCAINRHGAWWYNECAASNFNGEYFGPRDSYRSIEWETLPGSIYNIQFTEMKIRPFAG